MKDTDKPMVDMPTLRKDLYLVMSLLLAAKELKQAVWGYFWSLSEYISRIGSTSFIHSRRFI